MGWRLLFRSGAWAVVGGVLTGCAWLSPRGSSAPAPQVPAAWQSPVPPEAAGPSMAALSRWWTQFDDPLLSQLIDAAQAVSPTVASAALRIEQARLDAAQARSALLPAVDAQAGVSRGRPDALTPVTTAQSASLSARWEVDVFGASRAAQETARARWSGAQAGWHDARVVVAAEVAQAYLGLRACEAQLVPIEVDARSRQEAARLTELSARAGLQAPATAALARASAAQGQGQVLQQRAQCGVSEQSLRALTGWAPDRLREALALRRARLPRPAQLVVATVPAQVLAQRPDVFDAERTVFAAEAGVTLQTALQYPRIALQGNIGRSRVETGGQTLSGTVWTVGPLSVTFPVFDGGLQRANVDFAQAQVTEARSRYAATLRRAVQEVEESLIQLQAANERQIYAQEAVAGFEQSFQATQARFRVGSASVLELEDTRRSLAQAQTTWIGLQQSQISAWISLYRALGGGWAPAGEPASSSSSSTPLSEPTP